MRRWVGHKRKQSSRTHALEQVWHDDKFNPVRIAFGGSLLGVPPPLLRTVLAANLNPTDPIGRGSTPALSFSAWFLPLGASRNSGVRTPYPRPWVPRGTRDKKASASAFYAWVPTIGAFRKSGVRTPDPPPWVPPGPKMLPRLMHGLQSSWLIRSTDGQPKTLA